MAVPKKKKSSAATRRQRDAYKKSQQRKLQGAIDKTIRNEKGIAILAAEKAAKKASSVSENVTVVQA